MSRFLLMVILLIGSFSVHAQVQAPGCPPGVVPGQPGCGGSDEDSSYRGPIWQDRFGAIATSSTTTAGGVAANMSTARAARKKAISDCGASDCKISMETRNGCLAAAWGGGIAGYGRDADLRSAEAAALESCKSGGGTDCKIDYSACSLPVRIR